MVLPNGRVFGRERLKGLNGLLERLGKCSSLNIANITFGCRQSRNNAVRLISAKYNFAPYLAPLRIRIS